MNKRCGAIGLGEARVHVLAEASAVAHRRPLFRDLAMPGQMATGSRQLVSIATLPWKKRWCYLPPGPKGDVHPELAAEHIRLKLLVVAPDMGGRVPKEPSVFTKTRRNAETLQVFSPTPSWAILFLVG